MTASAIVNQRDPGQDAWSRARVARPTAAKPQTLTQGGIAPGSVSSWSSSPSSSSSACLDGRLGKPGKGAAFCGGRMDSVAGRGAGAGRTLPTGANLAADFGPAWTAAGCG